MSAFKRLSIAAMISVGLFASAVAWAVVIDFEAATPDVFITTPLSEDGYTFTVDAGHYDIENGGDQYMVLDEVGLGFTTVTLTRDDGGLFDVISFDVVDPADVGEFSILAVGSSGSIIAPNSTGIFNFGAGFQGISALVFMQIEVGVFGFDDLVLEPATDVPEPATLFLLGVGLIGLGYARFRRQG